MRALIVAPWLMILTAQAAPAQPERYELGERLKAFEKAWDWQTDPAARKRALAILPKLTGQYFAGQLGEAGRTLSEARWALSSDKPMPDDVAWAWSLYIEPQQRIGMLGQRTLDIRIRAFYPVKAERPAKLEVRLKLDGGKNVTIPVETLPATKTLDAISGEETKAGMSLTKAVVAGVFTNVKGKPVPISSRQLLWLNETDHMRIHGDFWASSAKKTHPNGGLELATVAERIATLRRVVRGETFEADAMLEGWFEAFSDLATPPVGRSGPVPYFTPDHPGDFWLAFPTGKGQRIPARLFVPKNLDPKKPIPLVVALHGMGGSENLFFEGYGDGQIVKLCEKRGWLLVAPRCPLFGAPPVQEIVDQLSKRYPVDPKRVFLVGHSLGASQSVDLVQTHPGTFAGVALLGGGGKVTDARKFADLPTFVGVGTQDRLSLGMVRELKKALTDAKAAKLTYKEYEDLEHLVIVREALPDAFQMFDAVK